MFPKPSFYIVGNSSVIRVITTQKDVDEVLIHEIIDSSQAERSRSLTKTTPADLSYRYRIQCTTAVYSDFLKYVILLYKSPAVMHPIMSW